MSFSTVNIGVVSLPSRAEAAINSACDTFTVSGFGMTSDTSDLFSDTLKYVEVLLDNNKKVGKKVVKTSRWENNEVFFSALAFTNLSSIQEQTSALMVQEGKIYQKWKNSFSEIKTLSYFSAVDLVLVILEVKNEKFSKTNFCHVFLKAPEPLFSTTEPS